MYVKKVFPLLMLLFLTSCGVYYNTFYNAKKYYTEALETKEKNNNQVTPAIKEKFNKSISRCVYVLQEYPTSKYADDALLLMGQCYYEQEDYVKASIKFQEFERYYSASPLYPTAKLYLARTYLKLKEYENALTEYNSIINDNRFVEVRENAYLDLAEFYFNQGDHRQALNYLNSTIEMKTSKESELNALFRYAQIQYLTEEYEEAQASFQRVVRRRPPKRMESDARFYIGKIYMEIHNYEKAKSVFEKLKKDEFNQDKIYEIDLQIGLCNAYLGNFDQAFDTFEKIITKNKNKSIAIEAYYHWGNIYFLLLDDYEKAIEKFGEITSKDKNNEWVKKAIKKNDIANQFLTLKTVDPTEDVQAWAEAQFKIAEYYLLDEDKPDSAIAVYDKIIKQKSSFTAQLDSLTNKLKTIPINSLNMDSLSSTQDSTLNSSDTPQGEPMVDTIVTSLDSLVFATIGDTTRDTLSSQNQQLLLLPDSTLQDSLPRSDTTSKENTLDSLENIEDTLYIPQDTLVYMADSLQQRINKLKDEMSHYFAEVYPRALLLKAWTLLKVKNDTTAAYNVVTLLQNELPDSEYNFAVQSMLKGKPVTLITQYEYEAKDYFNKAMKYYTNKLPIDSAFVYLDTIIGSYQESEAYPKALYAKANLLLEEFSDTTGAKPYLKTLVTDFPNHELTQIVSGYFTGEHFVTTKEETETIPDSTKTDTIGTYENASDSTNKETTDSDIAIPDSSLIDSTSSDSANITQPSGQDKNNNENKSP
jgi:tetratricopeptide (TPR) repeat protein